MSVGDGQIDVNTVIRGKSSIFAPIEVVVTNSVMLVYKFLINVIDFGNIAGTDIFGF